MKKLYWVWLSCFIVWGLFTLTFISCEESGPGSLTILHTNDIHGSFLPSPATWVKTEEKPLIGGFLALNYYVRRVNGEVDNVLFLDAGDLMTGNIICEMEFQGAQGGALIHFMNQLGYEGMTLGNHEFDISQENCLKLIRLAQFPIFTANLFTKEGLPKEEKLFTPEAYHIYQKGKLRVGVIGVITEELFDVLGYGKKEGLKLKPEAETIEHIVDTIDPQTDLIIVLSHCGADRDSILATRLSRRVDVIVGGHSHTRITKPRLVNRKLMVQAGTGCRNLGRLDLTVVADTVQSYSGQLIDLWVEGIEKNPSLEKEIEHFKKQIDEEYGKVIAHLETDWTRASHRESNIGNFLTDCMREYAHTDFALINSGGIRKDLPSGEIKKMDIKEILPFDNVICTFEVTGAQLMKILQENAQAAVYRTGGVLQVSGLSYRWKKQPNGSIKIVKALVNGKPINSKATYTGATVDFVLLANAQNYLGFEPEIKKNLMVKFTDVVMEMVAQKGRIRSMVEGRMKGK